MFSNGCDIWHKCFQMVVTIRHQKTSHQNVLKVALLVAMFVLFIRYDLDM